LLRACFAHADIEPIAGSGACLEFLNANAGAGCGRAQRLDVVALPPLHWGPGHREVVAGDSAQLLDAQTFLDLVLGCAQPRFGGIDVGLARLVSDGELAHLGGELRIGIIIAIWRDGAALDAASFAEWAVLAFLAASDPTFRR